MRYLIVIAVVLAAVLVGGCTTAIGNDKNGDYLIMTLFQGTATGTMDPKTGVGKWRRTGPTDMSGVEILKEGQDYIISFDKTKSATEWDKMVRILELIESYKRAKP